ncbi:MAG: HlyD family type I secretion periplasmic adaptor subunit [Azonexus sp.]|jgi:protease secretion system membrane fusion protein|uniref:HlyD family type I secretion periplasmic adaptor subunit n=1 Tax=Azonexus sp. TaxID=1872668 RepID=UPI00282A0685|nr:HlyD family type I secretion periplasmic adaptor subunit [Azonexus sp.]MDR0775404.1 HlyD family type I secretion periplasmic adaptor subunit [Azonexus sp.]
MSFRDYLNNAIRTVVDFLKPAPQEEGEEGSEGLPTDTRGPARLGFWVLGVGFGGFLLWAAFAPLNEGVPTSGMVTIETKRKAVQHIAGGIIKVVHVKEGQFVRAGDPLIELDAAATQANFESARLRYYTLQAMEDRLTAEQTGQKEIIFHPDIVVARQKDLLVDNMLKNQEGLFLSRRMSLAAEISAMEETIRGQAASITGYSGLLEARRAQLGFLKEESVGLRDLVAEGYAPKNDLLALERSKAEAMGSIADLQGNIERAQRATAEMRLRITQRQQDFRKEVDTQLADVRSQAQAEQERFEALKADLGRTVIRAPAEGQVVGLAAQTVGGVIAPGQKIMDIVPQNETLLLETHVLPHLIDRVQPGRETDVRFSAFAHSPQLVVPGKVESISADLLTDEKSGVSYYLARVSVTEEGMKILGNRQMYPGMPAEVVIVTGERSMLVYLLRPLLKRIAVSMKEE